MRVARAPTIAGLPAVALAVALLAACPAAAQIGDPVAPPPSGVVPLPPGPGAGENPDDPLRVPPLAPPQALPEPVDIYETEPIISKDLDQLPEPVRRMRALIVEAARSGDPERLRPLLGTGEGATRLSFGETGDDPIAYLKSISGDPEGHEMLAILLDVLEAGYARVAPDTENELFVWPYFFALTLDELTPPQRVELFKLVTAGDFEEMANYGSYIFFRAGFAPDGRWLFFVAGD